MVLASDSNLQIDRAYLNIGYERLQVPASNLEDDIPLPIHGRYQIPLYFYVPSEIREGPQTARLWLLIEGKKWHSEIFGFTQLARDTALPS